MKRLILVCLALVCISGINAQDVNIAGPSTYIKCSKFYITKRVDELPIAKHKEHSVIREAADSMRRVRAKANAARFIPGPVLIDPVVQSAQAENASAGSPPIVNFDGDVCSEEPPDPNGAVGPSYFVESINSEYHVFDKLGNSVVGPVDLATLFPGSEDDGDPIVMYDKFADRWFISEFQVPFSGPNYLLVAVSVTNDPTGAYYTWWFNVGSNFPDYPKYSIWTDGYYCTAQFDPQQIIVLERNRMLKGSPSAGMITASLPSNTPFGGNNSLYDAPKTLDCDGPLPPYGTPNYLVFFENISSGGYSNSIVMYKLATDTGVAKSITVTASDSMPTSAFNAYFNGSSYTDIAQPGAGNSLDALDGTFNYRVPFMPFPGYNSVVLCNTVNMGGLVSGIRWYEIRQDNVTKKWSIYQQSTYSPAGGLSRWNASICMDNYGDIGLAYSVSSNSVYPGIRYTGRLASDPLNMMTVAEQTAISGSASWITPNNRWGDYSQTTLDPSDGFTFWHVNEYIGAGSTENSRIFSFNIGTVGVQNIYKNIVSKIYQSGSELNITATGLPTSDKVLVDFFTIEGKQLSSQSIVPASGTIETQINVSGLASGIYFVRIGNANFQDVKKVEVNK